MHVYDAPITNDRPAPRDAPDARDGSVAPAGDPLHRARFPPSAVAPTPSQQGGRQ